MATRCMGPNLADIVFVGLEPTAVDIVRKGVLTGEDGYVFKQRYLIPLGLQKENVQLYNILDAPLEQSSPETIEQQSKEAIEYLSSLPHKPLIVALSQAVRQILGNIAEITLPHPAVIRRYPDSSELTRKLKQVQQRVKKYARLGDDGERGEAEKIWFSRWQEFIPPEGNGEFVYHHHWRGLDQAEQLYTHAELHEAKKAFHGDLRFTGPGDDCWGWTVFLGDSRENFSLPNQDRLIDSMGDGKRLRVLPKRPHNRGWMAFGDGDGTTIEEGNSKLFTMTRGTYSLGVMHDNLLEITLDSPLLNGRYLIRRADIGNAQIWLLEKPQEPQSVAESSKIAEVAEDLRKKGSRYLYWKVPGSTGDLYDLREGQNKDPSAATPVRVVKSYAEKQIVYGVVLDPTRVDFHDDYIPPRTIEETAHAWLAKSRMMSVDHQKRVMAFPVESWIEQYPSDEDYKNALLGLPHRSYRRKFGNDVVHSGSWVLATKLSDDLWKRYQEGDLNSYSIEGYTIRKKITFAELPQITFIDLVEAPANAGE